MVDQSVVKSVRNYLRSINSEGISIRFGIVFGSRATGHADRWSDPALTDQETGGI